MTNVCKQCLGTCLVCRVRPGQIQGNVRSVTGICPPLPRLYVIWGPSSNLFHGCQKPFPQDYEARITRLNTHLCIEITPLMRIIISSQLPISHNFDLPFNFNMESMLQLE